MTMATGPVRTAAETALVEAFDAAKESLPGGEALLPAREAAMDVIRLNGLPHRRVEAYKYTDLRALYGRQDPAELQGSGASESDASPTDGIWAGVERSVLRFVNGHMTSSELNLPAGVSAKPVFDHLSEEPPAKPLAARYSGAETDAVLAMNIATAVDGMSLIIEPSDGMPIFEFHHHTAAQGPADSAARHRIKLQDGAKATILVSMTGASDRAVRENLSFEVDLGKGAELVFVSHQPHAKAVTQFSTVLASVAEGAKLDMFHLVSGSGLSRQQNFIRFAGEGAKVTQRTLSLVTDGQQADIVHNIDHAVPNCESEDIHRVVADGNGKSVYQGMIMVRQDAQHTDGRMMTNALLLSDDAEAIAKPELEIFADDVQCAHGATTGQLDEDQVFYLMSRGLNREAAEHLLLEAFLTEVIEDFDEGPIGEGLQQAVGAWLNNRWQRNEEAAA